MCGIPSESAVAAVSSRVDPSFGSGACGGNGVLPVAASQCGGWSSIGASVPLFVSFPYRSGVVRLGPFHTPWLTFIAWIVIAGSILLAVGWSLGSREEDER